MILWGFTLGEAEPYLEERKRDRLFREAVIAFLTSGDGRGPEERYCEACRAAGLDRDCETCDRQVEILDVQHRNPHHH